LQGGLVISISVLLTSRNKEEHVKEDTGIELLGVSTYSIPFLFFTLTGSHTYYTMSNIRFSRFEVFSRVIHNASFLHNIGLTYVVPAGRVDLSCHYWQVRITVSLNLATYDISYADEIVYDTE
jgi:hypothetical protein